MAEMLSVFQEYQLNILLLLGITLFFGTVGARIFKKYRIPQVVAYIIIGIILGNTGVGILNESIIETFSAFNYFALGLIGFLVGTELKKEIFKKYGKQLINIVLSESLGAFIIVTLVVVFIGNFFFDSTPVIWSLGLILGAISAATAPAATTDVLWEYKTRGPLTTTIFGIVGMDDGLSLILFAIATSVASGLLGQSDSGFISQSMHTLYEIGGSIGIGVLGGLSLSWVVKNLQEEYGILTFSVGLILLILGIANLLEMDILLSSMTAGIIVSNYIPRKSKEVSGLLGKITPPIYILFFTLFGAKLDIGHLTFPIVIIAAIYLAGRTLGKGLGANIGGRISKAPETVRKYLPFCLFSQAGVAIGLSIMVSHQFPGNIGNTVAVVITTTTFIVQLIGPISTKWAVKKAEEIGLNITEDDIIRESKAKDLMDKNIPLIYENMNLKGILEIFSETDNLYYPVVNQTGKLEGVLTVDNIKNSLMTSNLEWFLLAFDLMEPAVATVGSQTEMTEVMEILNRKNLEYLPVTSGDNKVLGFIERRAMNRKISTMIIERQQKAEKLGEN